MLAKKHAATVPPHAFAAVRSGLSIPIRRCGSDPNGSLATRLSPSSFRLTVAWKGGASWLPISKGVLRHVTDARRPASHLQKQFRCPEIFLCRRRLRAGSVTRAERKLAGTIHASPTADTNPSTLTGVLLHSTPATF